VARQAKAQNNRSVVVGRDVINSIIVTGDHNRVFVGDYERLRDAYIEPWSVFERVGLEHFTGREWLLAEVDAFLRDHDRGYFVLEAAAGLGKTTFLAWLVRERGYIHHFIELAPGLDGVGRGLKNLAAQIVLAYHLSAWEAEGVLPGAATRPDFLLNLLKQAAGQRQEGEKIVLVVDALDEAGTPCSQNVLGLPQVLPEGVFVIVSQRPVPVTLHMDAATTPRSVFRLAAGSDENQADMRRFLERAAAWPGVARGLQESGYAPERFVAALLEKCRGLWIYLHYVVHEIKRGERSPLDLDTLPDGMTQYYVRYWQRWRDKDEDEWYKTYLPLLSTLAAAQEAVAIEQLARWSGVNLPLQRLGRLLNEQWRPFLAVARQDGKEHYRLYHATLREFFDGWSERSRLTTTEAALVDELAAATRQAHTRIADRYLGAWGGLEASLPGLQDPAKRDLDGGYGLRHLAAHLYALRDVEPYRQYLYELVESQSWTAAKYVDTPWAGSLVQDLHLASAAAAGGNIEDWARAMGHQLRRALIEQLMSRVSKRTILFLARLGEVERALDYARRRWDSFKLLREIARDIASTPPAKAVDVLAELAHLYDNRSASEKCIARLAAAQEILRLASSHRRMALDLIGEARRLEHAIPEPDLAKYRVVWDLPALALSGKLSAALAASNSLPPLQQAQALRQISLALPQDHASKRNLLEQALSALKALEQTPEVASEKMKALVALLPLVGAGERKGLLNSLESAGDYLRSVEAPAEYAAIPHWAVGRVAQIDLDWARRMLLEPKWGSTPDVLYGVVQEIARVDYEEALQIVRDRLSNHMLAPQLLVHIIGIIATEDTERAEAVIEEHAERLRDDKGDAHIAVAEAYLANGDTQKAREILDQYTVVSDGEGFAHARADLQLAILKRSRDFLSVEAALDRLMQFPVCPRCRKSRGKEAEVVLARMAARQNNLDILKQYRFGRDAQLAAAVDLADCAGPQVAREYLQSQHIDSFTEGAEGVYAHIAAVEAQQDMAKLEALLEEHFNGNGQPHDCCPYMREWPYALRRLVETGRIESPQAKSLIEQLYPLLVDWKCTREGQPPEQEFWKARCDCYDYSEGILAQLIGVMAMVNPGRSEEMVSALPAQPIRVYALKQVLYHTQPHEALVHRIIAACQECIADSWQRAGSYYLLAVSLPVGMSDTIKHLIELAEPLLSESPTEYYTNKFGMPIRVGPSSTELSIRKAQALMKLVGNVGQFAHVVESLRVIENLVQLDDKLRVLGVLEQQAREWPDEDRLALLRRVREIATTGKLLDVQVLIAASVLIVHSLGGEKAFWRLQHCVEQAYQGLPQVSRPHDFPAASGPPAIRVKR